MKRWCCSSCKHIHTGINPPMTCPECEADQEKFVYRNLSKEDYAKLRGNKKVASNNADIIILGSGVSAFTAAITATYYGASTIILEAATSIGGDDFTGFCTSEKKAAYSAIKSLEKDGDSLGPEHTGYAGTAISMLELLAGEDLLTEFKVAKHDPSGANHPWQAFAESTVLDEHSQTSPELKRTLHHLLAHWATDNGIRMLLNHEIIGLEADDQRVSKVLIEFNDKQKTYEADLGVISFLDNTEELLGKKAGNLKNLYNIGHATTRDLTEAEIRFWGEDSCIGPAMTEAYKSSIDLVKTKGLPVVDLTE